MATRLEDEFDPTRINAPDAAYPAGSLKDETTPGVSDDGTPLASRVGNDWQGFSQSALDKAGIAANGQPDSVSNPQILQAIEQMYNDGDSQLAGGNIWPLSSQDSAQVGDEIPPGTLFLRDSISNALYAMSPIVNGNLDSVDYDEGEAVIETTPVLIEGSHVNTPDITVLKSSNWATFATVKTTSYYPGWAAINSIYTGSAVYKIWKLDAYRASIGDPSWIPDEYADHTVQGGKVAVIQRNADNSIDVMQCGAYNNGSNSDATTKATQAALDKGGITTAPHGQFWLNDTVSITATNGEFICASKVGSLWGADPALSSVGTNNTLFEINVQPYNGSIQSMRFKTFGPYTGWAITAGQSINGFNGFSVTLRDIWFDFASSGAGFYRGGFFDSFCLDCQFENGRTRFNLTDGGNRSHWDVINDIGTFSPFIIHKQAGFSYANHFSNFVTSIAVGNAVATAGLYIDIENAREWKFSNMTYSAGSPTFDPATSFTTFAKIVNSEVTFEDVDINVYNLGTSDLTGLDITSSDVTFSGKILNKYVDDGRSILPVKVSGLDNDVKIRSTDILAGRNAQIELTSGCGGKITVNSSTLRESSTKIMRTTGPCSIDVTITDNELVNPFWEAPPSAANIAITLDTTGDVIIANNPKIGRDAEGEAGDKSAIDKIYQIVNASTESRVTGNNYTRIPLNDLQTSSHSAIPSDLVTGSQSLVDEGVITLPENASGIATVHCGNEAASFFFDSKPATKTVTKLYGTANTEAANIDGNLCGYFANNLTPRIANRLGQTEEIVIDFKYS